MNLIIHIALLDKSQNSKFLAQSIHHVHKYKAVDFVSTFRSMSPTDSLAGKIRKSPADTCVSPMVTSTLPDKLVKDEYTNDTVEYYFLKPTFRVMP